MLKKILPKPLPWAWGLSLMFVVGNAAQAQAQAQPQPQPQPQLTCQVTYAGATQTVVARPVLDPYPVPSVDIGGRFWFKPIVVGTAQKIDRIVIYSYLDTPTQPLLVHQVKYLPPFPAYKTPVPITGQNHVYGGPLERELIYSCRLEGWAP